MKKKSNTNKEDALKACKKTKTHLEKIFNYIQEGIILVDLKLNILDVNDSFCRIFECKKEEITGKKIIKTKILKALGKKNFIKELKVLKEGKKISLRNKEVEIKNSKKIIEINATPIKYKGKITSIVAVARNITARKNDREEIVSNQNKYENLFNKIPISLGIFHLNGNVSELNQRIKKLFDIKKQSKKKINFFDFFEEKEEVKKIKKELESFGEVENYQASLSKGKQGYFWANIIIKKVRIKNHDKYLISIFDFSKRKRAIEVLQRNEKRYRALFSNMVYGFALHKVILDKTGKPKDYYFVEVNEGFEKAFGFRKEELGGKTITEVIPEIKKDTINWVRDLGMVAVNNNNLSFEKYSKIFDKWFSVSAYSPNKGYFVTLVEDITERKMNEKKLRESKQKLALHVKNTPLGVIEWDVDFKVTNWNLAAEKIFGYKKEDVIGKSGDFLIKKGDDQKLKLIWKKIILKKGGERNVNQNITKKGKVRICDWYNTPLVDENNRVFGVASLVMDITERVKAKKELEDKVDELELMNKLMVGREIKMVELKDKIKKLEYMLSKKR